MNQVQIAYAKTHLSGLLERVEGGEEIVIARRGRAIARLIREPVSLETAADVFGKVWAVGGGKGLTIEAPAELSLPNRDVDLD